MGVAADAMNYCYDTTQRKSYELQSVDEDGRILTTRGRRSLESWFGGRRELLDSDLGCRYEQCRSCIKFGVRRIALGLYWYLREVWDLVVRKVSN